MLPVGEGLIPVSFPIKFFIILLKDGSSSVHHFNNILRKNTSGVSQEIF